MGIHPNPGRCGVCVCLRMAGVMCPWQVWINYAETPHFVLGGRKLHSPPHHHADAHADADADSHADADAGAHAHASPQGSNDARRQHPVPITRAP